MHAQEVKSGQAQEHEPHSTEGGCGEHWVGCVGVGASRVLGPAAASPLTQGASSWLATAASPIAS